MVVATFKAAALDTDVVAVVAVAAIRAAVVTKDVADGDTTGKAVGAKIRTIMGTRAPTTKATQVLATKAVEAGSTAAGPITCPTPHRYSLSLRMLRAFTTCPYPAS